MCEMKTTFAEAPLTLTVSAGELPIKKSLKNTTTISVGGGKGGVGKTLFAINLAHELRLQDHRVLLIDCDFTSPCLHHFFQIQQPSDVLLEFEKNNNFDIEKLIYKTEFPGIDVLFRHPDSLRISDTNLLFAARLLRKVMKLDYDYVIFDLGSGINETDIYIFLNTKEQIMLGTPEPTVIAENYRFLKMCALKKLESLFRDDEEKLKVIRKAYFQNDEQISFAIKSLVNGNNGGKNEAREHLKNFKPYYVLNMSDCEEDSKLVRSFNLAIKDSYGIEIKYLGSVPYFKEIRRYLRTNDRNQLLERLHDATEIFTELIEKLSGQKEEQRQKYSGRKALKKLGDFVDVNTIICSTHCKIWGNCNYQMGGYPCRIKYIGFAYQN